MPPKRHTRQRAAIEDVFETTHRPLGPNEVLELARESVKHLGIATVYRALNDLVAEGILKPVELPGQPPRYEKADLKHHHHFHCQQCDKVFDLEGCLLKSDLHVPPGFEVRGHEITLRGLCPDCGQVS